MTDTAVHKKNLEKKITLKNYYKKYSKFQSEIRLKLKMKMYEVLKVRGLKEILIEKKKEYAV